MLHPEEILMLLCSALDCFGAAMLIAMGGV